MGLFDLTTASDALEDLLERERGAVLDGRFDLLERMSAEKERLVQTVARNGAPPAALERLRAGTKRNGQLLEAMQAGIAAAQARLKSMRGRGETLQTYDASGRKSAMASPPKKAGHRA